MSRKKPEPSDELAYLRQVMHQDQADDDPGDVGLGRWRDRINEKPEWVMARLGAAEKEYQESLDAWAKENRKEKTPAAEADLDNAECLALVDKLIKKHLEKAG